MGFLGQLAASAALNTLDFIADDLVTLKCFGVDTFCNSSINKASDISEEEDEAEDFAKEEDDDDEDVSSERISLCNRLFNLELDEIVERLAESDKSEEDDLEEEELEDEDSDEEDDLIEENESYGFSTLMSMIKQCIQDDEKSKRLSEFLKELNAIEPEGVLDYSAALGGKDDLKEDDSKKTSDLNNKRRGISVLIDE